MEQKKKLQLQNVTLAAMTSVNIYETIQALLYSMRGIDFGEVILITDKKPFLLPRGISYRHTSRLDSIDAFNYKMTYELKDHIHTDYALIVHADGFVIHPELWRDDFLKYDYIGAPWPLPENAYAYRDSKGMVCRVGNSVSIRSRRLMRFPAEHHLKWEPVDDGYYNEDIFICCHARNEMEQYGLTWAPIDVAVHFGREHMLPENAGIEPFSFHKWRGENHNYPRFVSPQRGVRNILRPFLIWRKSQKWRSRHGFE